MPKLIRHSDDKAKIVITDNLDAAIVRELGVYEKIGKWLPIEEAAQLQDQINGQRGKLIAQRNRSRGRR